jgi:hypothetical protein
VENCTHDKIQHINFVVFRNKREKAETAICLIKDAKGITLLLKGLVSCLERAVLLISYLI